MKNLKQRLLLTSLCAFGAGITPVLAQEDDFTDITGEDEDTIYVWGRAIDLIGVAGAASEGVVGYDDFETRPLSRPGELVEVIPGMIATQHSGTGKANQYFLRGFNLDHGTDFSASIDGVPVNMRTHGHGQGYLDLNFMIPEIVEKVEYTKGPYFADNGDFSAAGTAAFTTYDMLDDDFAEIALGENGYVRGVGAMDATAGDVTFLLAGEAEIYDGPWVMEENLEKLNLLAKGSWGSASARYELSASLYDASWNSTDQVPRRAIESGRIDRLGFIEPDAGGTTTRIGLTGAADWQTAFGNTSATAYIVDYDFRLFSNFTYFLDDPVNGDEFEQRDERRIYGLKIENAWPEMEWAIPVQLRAGGDVRYDDISNVGLFKTVSRERIGTVRQDSVEELSLSAWAEASLALSPSLRAIAGLRADHYDVSVDAASLPANSGDAEDSLVSPSLGLAWRASEILELYANYGQGFHSNDARGATIEIDPGTAQPVDPVDILVPAEGTEIGARLEAGPLNASLALFHLDLDSELVFVGDAGTTEPNGATQRTGVELTGFLEATDWLTLDLSAAYTDAEYKNEPDGLDNIPGAVKTVLGGGAVARWGRLTSSLRVRHFGEAPLTEDGAIKSDPTTLVNLGTDYRFDRFTLGLEVLNIFDSEDADITYFYESRLSGEANPIEDIHFHPVEPRTARVYLRARF